jgi:hypothetical protein
VNLHENYPCTFRACRAWDSARASRTNADHSIPAASPVCALLSRRCSGPNRRAARSASRFVRLPADYKHVTAATEGYKEPAEQATVPQHCGPSRTRELWAFPNDWVQTCD